MIAHFITMKGHAMLKPLFATTILTLALSGCATLTNPAITPQQVIVASNAFDLIEVTATNYMKLPPCPGAKLCRTSAVIAAIVPAIRAGRAARNTLEKDISANASGALVPVTDYQALTAATSALQTLLAQ